MPAKPAVSGVQGQPSAHSPDPIERMGGGAHCPMTRREAAVAMLGSSVALVVVVLIVLWLQSWPPAAPLETRDCPVPYAVAFPSGCQP